MASSALMAACKNDNNNTTVSSESITDGNGEMTYRTNPNTGDRVSLLGYGMMRLPVVGGGSMRDNPDADIDQELVNQQIDYALEHGVNYIDTSPVYCKGLSEHSTGIALARHPRKSYYLATKLSNFSPETWSRAASQQMFENSLKELQTDYVDYLLLHAIGGFSDELDSLQTFNGRYMDNGILDWLVEQKTKGRIRNLGFSYHGDIKIFDMLLQWHDEGRYHWDFVQIELNYLDWDFADEINPRNTDASYLYNELQRRSIPAIFSHYNKCIAEGNHPHPDDRDENYSRQRRAFLVGYDRSVPKLRQASHCIGCGQCAPHCPQQIDIPTEMRMIDDYVEKLKTNG